MAWGVATVATGREGKKCCIVKGLHLMNTHVRLWWRVLNIEGGSGTARPPLIAGVKMTLLFVVGNYSKPRGTNEKRNEVEGKSRKGSRTVIAWYLGKVIAHWNGICYHSGMEQSCHCKGVDLPSLHRWEVVRMKYDFKDLMAFGMFILALLTFIFYNCK